MKKQNLQYGIIRSTEELGRIVRTHRKNRRLTLKTVSGLGNLSSRFLSEFERGKETAEVGKILTALRTVGLEIIVRPRGGPLSPEILKNKRETDE